VLRTAGSESGLKKAAAKPFKKGETNGLYYNEGTP